MQNSTDGFQEFLSNFSRVAEDGSSSYHRHVLTRVLGSLSTLFIALVALSGNSAVIYITFRNENLSSHPSNLYSVYLSVGDIVVSVLVLIPSAISVLLDYWPFGHTMCHINAVLFNIGACFTTKMILLIGLDRAYAVNYPFEYTVKVTRGRAAAAGLIAVGLSAVDGILLGTKDWIRYDYFEGICAVDFGKSFERKYLTSSGAVICILIPAMIIGISYASVIAAAKRQKNTAHRIFVRRNPQNLSSTEADEKEIAKKTTRSMLAVAAAYYICYSPAAVFRISKIFYDVEFPPFDYLANIFLFVSSSVNPFIYAIFRKDYMNAFKRLFKQIAGHFRDENGG